MSLLEIKDLQFLTTPPFSLIIDNGECISLAGESGSGKTMLLRAIADLDPHSGSIYLNQQECSDITPSEWRRQVAFLPADSQWWEDLVIDHFPPSAQNKLTTFLEKLALPEHILQQKQSRLSSGERQRLAIVRLIVLEPRILLLDEPTSNLDQQNTARVESLILDYLEQNQAAALWVSHDPAQAKRVGDRHYCLDNHNFSQITSPAQ